ncbi:hypothetical protein SEMRO_1801_G298510.1 [Seminavis robusta]|uniref:Uncharacterized protein n=1 Tax=Seminavis robusta TaxID=568900 RepID=A0A9N8ETU6_9STRA|nr:hypothetical protein SEMRO_1801_G298510.1 [Seminavis robusta]|eukprot:Sro1801_g298510.1 n/a (167) ;mRNA; f:16263-16763
MGASIRRLESHFMGDAPESDVPRTAAKKFSVSTKGVTPQTLVVDVFVNIFVENYPDGMALEQNSKEWNDMTEREKKSHRNRFSQIKHAVRMVLMHADSFPPTSDKQFKQTLRKIAIAAVDCIRDSFDFRSRTITFNKLADHSKTKEREKTLEFPPNTPEDIRKIFN